MRTKIFAMSLAAMLGLITGCSKSSGSSNQGVMGQAVRPGYFPDGTKATPVTKAQAQQVMQTFSGTLSVLDALTQASPSSNFNPLNVTPPSASADSLTQLIQQNCVIVSPDIQPPADTNHSSQPVVIDGQGSISGPNCPLSGQSTVHGNAQVFATDNSAGQMQSFSANGQVKYHEDLSATNQMPPQYDFESMTADLSFSGQISGSPSSEAIAANIQGHAVINTKQLQNLDAVLLSQINVTSQQGHPSGDVKVAVIVKTPQQTLLIQLFTNASEPNSGQFYVNGQLVANPFSPQGLGKK